MILLNPKKHSRMYPDKRSEEIMLKTINFFEEKGKASLKHDDQERIWYQDFLDFIANEQIFSDLLTPSKYGSEHARWDMWRIQEFNEILGFYGLPYWYTWQVTILGLGPIWMSTNEKAKQKAANLLKNGAVFAFGLSEKEHGADVYSSDMVVTKKADGTYVANGSKYYIGNANRAAMVSTFGKLADGGYIFFYADSQHPNYQLIKNTVNSQNYVGEFKLNDYPLTEDELLAIDEHAWNSALNTVNVGKYNLGWASIGICTHAFYEAINHAAKRNLYGMYATDFSHVKRLFTDAYTRLIAMKLYASRTADYMRSASLEDRRYLLYDPIMKMKVTTQGEDVINLMWDVIAAKGFEKDTFFEMAARDIRALPKLEGTVHVNIALISKFMKNFLFKPKKYEAIPQRNDVADDTFLFNQGPTGGLGTIQFHDYNEALNYFDLPNINLFKKQVAVFKESLLNAPATESQMKDIDVMLTIGEMFTLIPYAQLILENCKIYKIDAVLINQLFDFIVRDFSKYALEMYSKPSSTTQQMHYCLQMIQKPEVNENQFNTIWNTYVYSNVAVYEMNP